MSLSGKIALVTGAGRGLGLAYAEALASCGAHVIVNDTGVSLHGARADHELAEKSAAMLTQAGGHAEPDRTDVTDFSAVDAMIKRLIGKHGVVDIVVNNAGILRDRMLINMSEAEWDQVISVHLKGTFNVTRHVAAHWRAQAKLDQKRGGRVINITSHSGLLNNVGQSNYGAAKSAIATFSLIASQELAPYRVTVNAIAPLAFTRMADATFDFSSPGMRDRFTSARVAALVTFLASDEARNVTGQVFAVEGDQLALFNGWQRNGAVTVEPPFTQESIANAVVGLIPDLTARVRSLRNAVEGTPAANFFVHKDGRW